MVLIYNVFIKQFAGVFHMSNKKLDSGHVLGFVAVVATAFYARRLFGNVNSIGYGLAGLIATRILMPHMLFVAGALIFSVIGLFSQKRWCMLVAGVLMGVSALFMFEYVRYIVAPALLLFCAYADMA